MSDIGRRLGEECERVNGGVTAVAATVGAVRNTVYNWIEKGNVPADKLKAMEVLGVDFIYVMTGVRSSYPIQSQSQHAGLVAADSGSPAYALKADERALLDNYRHASRDGQKALRETSAALAKSAGCVKKSG